MLCIASAATPPQYTPAAGLSRVSSNDSINNLTEETAVQSTNAIDINMAVMADLVKDKMNELSPNENGNVFRCFLPVNCWPFL
jgi:hypothetical protein